ncbi:PilN domain-containing protein, partial [Leclercia adecarboxylata]|uniref:PilN domain-containing protein n=2 Tax=Gammaproteobacteria TaxID=1236 RepID=UPI00234C8058
MSMTINLLPWREAQRERQTRKFYLWIAVMLLAGVVMGLLTAQYYQHQLAAQQQRNAYISEHMVRLNADIEGVSRYQNDAGRLAEQLA